MCSLPAIGYDFDPPHLHSVVMTDLVHPPSQLPSICMPGCRSGDLPYLHNVVLTDREHKSSQLPPGVHAVLLLHITPCAVCRRCVSSAHGAQRLQGITYAAEKHASFDAQRRPSSSCAGAWGEVQVLGGPARVSVELPGCAAAGAGCSVLLCGVWRHGGGRAQGCQVTRVPYPTQSRLVSVCARHLSCLAVPSACLMRTCSIVRPTEPGMQPMKIPAMQSISTWGKMSHLHSSK